ncbi:MAG: Fic family protein [Candidatus Firestonebacteria bacterium]
MFKPKYSITNKINNDLTQIERVRGFLDAIRLKENWIADIQNHTLILESHYSTHIEGTALSLEQAKDILEGIPVKGINIEDRKELLNYKKAMNFISKYLGKDDPITEGLIRELHKITVKDVRGNRSDPGNYRKVQNYIVNSRTREIIYTPPFPLEVPHLMKEFVEWLNRQKDISPVLVAGIAQFQFVHIHPFLDGNGRTARLLSTFILYKTSYDFKRLFTISEYYDKNRPAYYKAIQSVRQNNMDMTEWLEYFVEGLQSQMVDIQEKGKRIISVEKLVKEYMLNTRQWKIIRYLVTNEHITNEECQKLCGSIRRTATRDLLFLVEKGLIEKKGERKGTYYIFSTGIKI